MDGKYDEASQAQLTSTATLLIVAGTETTNSMLCGAIYLILSNPAVWTKLCQEIRGAAENASDLNVESTHSMDYLSACLEEAMRVYPSILGTLSRIAPKGGAYICEKFVPQYTVVGVNHWATYRNPKNFKYPDEFRPERWIDPENGEYSGDRRSALQPFSYWPRRCIGNE
jgi:cytochrome P450